MLTVVFSWLGVLALVAAPFAVGCCLEQKLQLAKRGRSARFLRRY